MVLGKDLEKVGSRPRSPAMSGAEDPRLKYRAKKGYRKRAGHRPSSPARDHRRQDARQKTSINGGHKNPSINGGHKTAAGSKEEAADGS